MKSLDVALGIPNIVSIPKGSAGCEECICRACTTFKKAFPDEICSACHIKQKHTALCDGSLIVSCAHYSTKGGE